MDYNKLEKVALSNSNLVTIFKNMADTLPNIKEISEINNVKSLDELFMSKGKAFNHCILFVSTNSEFSGHWQILIRDNEYLFFYDSYGHNFSMLLKKVFSYFGQNAYDMTNRLGQLIESSEYFPSNVYMNLFKYQSNFTTDDTCGRHCSCCFLYYTVCKKNNKQFDFDGLYKFLTGVKESHHLKSFDDVSIYISQYYLQNKKNILGGSIMDFIKKFYNKANSLISGNVIKGISKLVKPGYSEKINRYGDYVMGME